MDREALKDNIKIDEDISGSLTTDKKNIAEINAYSTKYTSNQSIPDKKFDYQLICKRLIHL